jgi:protease-4
MGVLVYLFGLLAFAAWPKLMASLSEDDSARSVAVIDVVGVIDSKGRASAERINRALRRAFKEPGTVGVILRIDSPGGSPVQSAMIYDEVRRLRAKHKDIPLHAVIEDLGASGGYYVAASADRIHVSEASLVGSIGVIMNGFGFTGTMEKLGIERRMITSGENKGFLDPFSPVSPEQIEHAKGFLSEVHEQFIAAVKKGRGDRLKDDPKLFSGLVWTGASAVRLGLADGLGTVESVARDVLKADRIVDYSEQDTVLDRLSKKFGVGISEGMGSMLGMTQTPLR